MEEISIGSVVVLKSNPDVAMTVEVITDGKATCTWLNKSKKQEYGVFSLTSLEVYEGPAGILVG
ncbi:hypothetical protein LZ683_21165 [Comamonas testosteroni]|uniref:hypothetical protein n=1 Tax=Comamonas testosteroni TaxID=285 RepID=UPI0023AAEAD7|nr:hypothetical protein [Comamonas testosteroni]WEE76632.1 hypothetical protein LZ683_21165 [Comamonas testosteroni]